MDKSDEPREYPFPSAPERNEYRLFPDDMENDEHIFFHGTAEKNLASIVSYGFRISGDLPSVSFAKNSSLSLRYACEGRNDSAPCGVVLAVRYACLNKPGIVQESFGLHVYNFDEQPQIVGYCVVPASYVFT
jgi:hypothetical protein